METVLDRAKAELEQAGRWVDKWMWGAALGAAMRGAGLAATLGQDSADGRLVYLQCQAVAIEALHRMGPQRVLPLE